MDTKKVLILVSLFVLLVVLVVLFFSLRGEEKIKPGPDVAAIESEVEPGEEIELKKITLFFPAEEDPLLHPEEREIMASSSLILEAKRTLMELLKGSRNGYLSPFPPATRLKELYVTKEGIAHVDFSKEIQENHISGSTAEMATVFSIVNSLTYNFKSIKKVFILIEGGEKETLGGHINLTRPFLPKYDLVAE